MTTFYDLDIPSAKALNGQPQSIGFYDAILPVANTADSPAGSTTALNNGSALIANNPAQIENKRDALPPVAQAESKNELSNFAQSLFYSAIQRPAAAVTQMVDSIFPDALPHLEFEPPPSSSTIGGFLGDTLGNVLDLLLLSKFHIAPKLFGPALESGGLMWENSMLTPVANIPSGDSIWGHKLYSAGSAFVVGAVTRGMLGKGLPNFSPVTADYINMGATSVGRSIGDAFRQGPHSAFKLPDVLPTELTANTSGV
ncbi:hypothetical protein BH10CYA1_BH10CYA1_33940 [soil metagenome]